MKAIVTVIGKDRKGIIAKVSNFLYENEINIEDITQTIMQDYFSMVMMVNTDAISVDFTEIVKKATALGEEMGLEICGVHGTTAALALLNDAVKKGGVMASSRVGGLSGAFIPVSEDAGMIDAARSGDLSIEKLEAMTAVCSVGLDMIVIPGDTPPSTISAIIAETSVFIASMDCAP